MEMLVYTPLMFWAAVMIRLHAVRVLSGRGAGESCPVARFRMGPAPVPLSGVEWWVALLSVLLLRIPVVIISVSRPAVAMA